MSRRVVRTSYKCDGCGRLYGSKTEADVCEEGDARDEFNEWFRNEVAGLTDSLWFIDRRPTGEAFVAELRALVERYRPPPDNHARVPMVRR